MHIRAAVILLVLLTLVSGVAQASDVAFVSDVRGSVARQVSGAWTEAEVLARLPPGTHFRVGRGSVLALTFLSPKARVYVRGPVQVAVQADGPRFTPLTAEMEKQLKAMRATRGKRLAFRTAFKFIPSGVRLTSFHRFDTEQPTVTWIADAPYRAEELRIGGVLTQPLNAEAASFTIPSNTLRLGGSYEVELLARDGGGKVAKRTARLEIAPGAVVARLQEQRATAYQEFKQEPNDVSPLSELLGSYVEERLDARTLEVIDEIIKVRKDPAVCKDLYLRKIKILNERGLPAEAQKAFLEFQKALNEG